jgi:hypothetical protein
VQSTARPATVTLSNVHRALSKVAQPTPAPVSTPTPQTTDAATATPPETAEAEAEAERETAGHELDALARKLELDMKVKAEEDLAMLKSCLADDMRKVVEQLELDWEDTLKDPTQEGHLGEVQATLMMEAALDLVRYQDDALVRKAEEKGLQAFDASLINDDFFGKTARSLAKLEAERRARGVGYIFLASRLSAQEVASGVLHSRAEHEFLAQCLQEASFEAVSHI